MIPNLLTTVRLGLVPTFAYLMLCSHNLYAAAIVLVLSGITDIVDGYIARHFNMITNFGKIYDPFVDKLMQINVAVCLVIRGIIPIWLLLIVVFKEVTMIVIGGILYLKRIVVSSNWYGKTSTVIFYAAVLVMIIWNKNLPHSISVVVIAVMIASMLLAGIGYFVDTLKNYNKKRV